MSKFREMKKAMGILKDAEEIPKFTTIYQGRRTDEGVKVERVVQEIGSYFNDIKDLDPRYDLVNHSPTGFEFGYAGSGPSQLALAILADYFKDDQKALKYYYDFKMDKLVPLGGETFLISGTEIDEWFTRKEAYYKRCGQ